MLQKKEAAPYSRETASVIICPCYSFTRAGQTLNHTMPCAIIALATFMKPAMFAPFT